MAIPHAASGELIDVRPLDQAITPEADPLFGSEVGRRYQQLHRQILLAAGRTGKNA